MRSSVTIHPIDRPLMESLGIYDDCTLAPRKSLTTLLGKLYDVGYTEINHSSFVRDGVTNELGLHTHVTMKQDENGRYYKLDKHGMCHKV